MPFDPVVNMSNVIGIDFDYDDQKLFFTQIQPRTLIGWMDAKNPSKVWVFEFTLYWPLIGQFFWSYDMGNVNIQY